MSSHFTAAKPLAEVQSATLAGATPDAGASGVDSVPGVVATADAGSTVPSAAHLDPAAVPNRVIPPCDAQLVTHALQDACSDDALEH